MFPLRTLARPDVGAQPAKRFRSTSLGGSSAGHDTLEIYNLSFHNADLDFQLVKFFAYSLKTFAGATGSVSLGAMDMGPTRYGAMPSSRFPLANLVGVFLQPCNQRLPSCAVLSSVSCNRQSYVLQKLSLSQPLFSCLFLLQFFVLIKCFPWANFPPPLSIRFSSPTDSMS